MVKSESGLRRLAAREGYRLVKSRSRDLSENQGAFAVFDNSMNVPVLGFKFDADLEEVAEFLK
jgi:hypothetical protein